jgi:hypothetical protein
MLRKLGEAEDTGVLHIQDLVMQTRWKTIAKRLSWLCQGRWRGFCRC